MVNTLPTRGTGLLEALLAQFRASQANKLIPSQLRAGRILDIGCGSYPYFLSHTSFSEKFAIEQKQLSEGCSGIDLQILNLNEKPVLPYTDGFFSVITLLAVIEHLDPDKVVLLFTEIYRVLHESGVVIITTPASWSNRILKNMAQLHLVSSEEINEHVFTYTSPLIGWYFGRVGFAMGKIRCGYFELGLNLWAVAQK